MPEDLCALSEAARLAAAQRLLSLICMSVKNMEAQCAFIVSVLDFLLTYSANHNSHRGGGLKSGSLRTSFCFFLDPKINNI